MHISSKSSCSTCYAYYFNLLLSRKCPKCRTRILLWYLHPEVLVQKSTDKEYWSQKALTDNHMYEDLIHDLGIPSLYQSCLSIDDELKSILYDLVKSLQKDIDHMSADVFKKFNMLVETYCSSYKAFDRFVSELWKLTNEPKAVDTHTKVLNNCKKVLNLRKILRNLRIDCRDLLFVFVFV